MKVLNSAFASWNFLFFVKPDGFHHPWTRDSSNLGFRNLFDYLMMMMMMMMMIGCFFSSLNHSFKRKKHWGFVVPKFMDL